MTGILAANILAIDVLAAELDEMGAWIQTFEYSVAFVAGLVVGSFLNVVIYRLPLGKDLVRPPSACPGCGGSIRWFDNVPVLGWLCLRGRCRQCKAPISLRYPLVWAGVIEVRLIPLQQPVQVSSPSLIFSSR